jgi:DHA1 family multidrug resistance protein-like MFS transporter
MLIPILPLFVQWLAPLQERLATLTGTVNTVGMIATGFAAILAGRYADRIGVQKVLMASLLAGVLCYAGQSVVQSVTQLAMMRALTGLAEGAGVATLSAALAQAAPEGRQGVVFGLNNSVHAAANAIGPLLGGALAATWGLRLPYAAASLCFAMAACLLFAKRGSVAPSKRSTS